jgi:hypothetical protein
MATALSRRALTAAGKYVLRVSAVGKVRESRDFEVSQAQSCRQSWHDCHQGIQE